jgi:hypothetical protein
MKRQMWEALVTLKLPEAKTEEAVLHKALQGRILLTRAARIVALLA